MGGDGLRLLGQFVDVALGGGPVPLDLVPGVGQHLVCLGLGLGDDLVGVFLGVGHQLPGVWPASRRVCSAWARCALLSSRICWAWLRVSSACRLQVVKISSCSRVADSLSWATSRSVVEVSLSASCRALVLIASASRSAAARKSSVSRLAEARNSLAAVSASPTIPVACSSASPSNSSIREPRPAGVVALLPLQLTLRSRQLAPERLRLVTVLTSLILHVPEVLIHLAAVIAAEHPGAPRRSPPDKRR